MHGSLHTEDDDMLAGARAGADAGDTDAAASCPGLGVSAALPNAGAGTEL